MSQPGALGPGPVQPAIRVIMMPKDTNALGTIFGGIILSYIDQAGAVEAHRHDAGRLVTVAMNEGEFHHPVFVGDLVSFFTETVRIGRTSITVKVTVEAVRRPHRRGTELEQVKVTEATLTYVHVDADNKPVPVGGGGAAGATLFPGS
jgi:acyl-CoA thioesterase YciA